MPAERRPGARGVLAAAAALATLLAPRPLAAQFAEDRSVRRPRLELRADGFGGDPWAAHAGLGLSIPAGTYVRAGIVAAGGTSGGWDAGAATRASGRVDVVGRFLVDPFRQSRRAPYAAAGVSLRLDEGARPRYFLTAVLGLEGAVHRGWLPAVEAGFGGGVRAGMVLRRAPRDGR